jgi:hypothetical protein
MSPDQIPDQLIMKSHDLAWSRAKLQSSQLGSNLHALRCDVTNALPGPGSQISNLSINLYASPFRGDAAIYAFCVCTLHLSLDPNQVSSQAHIFSKTLRRDQGHTLTSGVYPHMCFDQDSCITSLPHIPS